MSIDPMIAWSKMRKNVKCGILIRNIMEHQGSNERNIEKREVFLNTITKHFTELQPHEAVGLACQLV